MAFARTETTVLNHSKFVGLDPAAIGLWTMGNVYCWDQLTDGFIPRSQVPRLLSWVRPNKCIELAEKLVAATASGRFTHGLWEHDGDDFRVHDWLDYNPPKDKILAEREAAKLRMRQRRGSGRSPERAPERSVERSPEQSPRSPARSRQEVEVERDSTAPPNVRPNARPDEAFNRDCQDPRWHGRCVNATWAQSHPGEYPASDAHGTPKQCPEHRAQRGAAVAGVVESMPW